MFKKMLIGMGLLVATTLSGCVVYGPPRPVVYAPAPVVYGPAVVVAPAPVWGWGWHGGGRWR